jgi:D-glycero-alpha-D-manno-heptose-7-phosphate kinase
MIISRTPFRISFFGGGTDYPVWYEKEDNHGAVLGTTIDKYCYITCRYLPPFFEHKYRIVYSLMEQVQKISEIRHPSVRETLKFMEVEAGVEVHHDGDLPARTGLGSSSSFTVGFLNALYALKGKMTGKKQLALDAIHVEQDLIGENVGSQDQVLTAFGGLNRVSFSQAGDFDIQPVILQPERLQAFQDHLMLFFTGISRTASEIAGEQIKQTPKKSRELAAIYDMVDEGTAILTSDGPISEFGKLLHESWQLKRGLTDKISTPEVDDIYAAAREAGALGGKLLGAGGGGFVLLFARPEDQPAVKTRLKRLLHVPFKFENLGSQIVFYEPEQANA